MGFDYEKISFNMKPTVVIPTLNEEKYIEKTLRSLMAQTIKPEIVVVDSGSTDKTIEIARKYTDKILAGKKNIAYNRQIGAEKASGEIIVTTDADCIHPRDWLSNLLKYFDDKSVVCVSGQTLPIGFADARDISSYDSEIKEESNFLDFLCYFISNLILKLLNDLFGKALFRGSNVAYRKDAFLKVGGYDTRLLAREDSELTRRLGKTGKTIFDMGIKVYTSMRRRQNLGWFKTMRYYLDTPISMITGKIYYEKAGDK